MSGLEEGRSKGGGGGGERTCDQERVKGGGEAEKRKELETESLTWEILGWRW